jgi:outer membrane protein assembly factor BamB
MKEKHRIAPHPAAFSFTLALLLVMITLFASSCGESSETRSLKATISAQATQLAEVAPPTVTMLASPTPPKAAGLASPTPLPPEPKPHASLTPIWSVKCRGEGKPLVVGDVVVASTPEYYVMGLVRTTGEKLWVWEVDGTAFAGDQERVYVYSWYPGSGYSVGGRYVEGALGRIYALDLHTGERVWKIEGPIANPHALLRHMPDAYHTLYPDDGTLYFAGRSKDETGCFVAVDASSGEEKWIYSFPSGDKILLTPLPEGLQVHSGLRTSLVHTVGPEPQTVGLDPRTGEVLWGPGESRREPSKWDIGNVQLLEHEGEAMDLSDGTIIWTWDRAVIGDPIGVWRDVVVFSNDPSLYGINAEDGAVLWDLDLQGRHTWVGASDGMGILLNPYGVYGVDMASGKRIWRVEKNLTWGAPLFALTDIGLFFFSEYEDMIDLIDPATGEVRWMEEVSGYLESFVDADDLVLIVSGDIRSYTLTAYKKVR